MKSQVLVAFIFALGVASGSKPEVSTSVVTEKPLVTLTCQVPVSETLTGCTFLDPSGNQLSPSDRYAVTPTSATGSQSCTLQIDDPVVADLGIWRCAVHTNVNTYFGFLVTLCPWAMRDPAVAAQVVSEPKLTAISPTVASVEGTELTLSCYIHSAARYCHFRSQNGSIFVPGSSDGTEYVGLGLDAGECGIRFPRLFASDSGSWSCHVGFVDPAEPEQRTAIRIDVEGLMSASQYHIENNRNTLVVQAQIYGQSPLEYCRFVRMDGLGFTTANLPTGYEDHSLLNSGRCEIRMHNPTILEQHPWTMVARIVGEDREITGSTDHTISMPAPEVPAEIEIDPLSGRGAGFWIFKIGVLIVMIGAFFSLGWMLGSRKSHNWASSFRNSIRNSFSKKPMPDFEAPTPKTLDASMAA